MKTFIAILTILSTSATAQELLPPPNSPPPLVEESSIATPTIAPENMAPLNIGAPMQAQPSQQQATSETSVFNNMMETLFGNSSLPTPEGSFQSNGSPENQPRSMTTNQTQDSAPMMSPEPNIAPPAMSGAPMAPMMNAPIMPIQPITAPAPPANPRVLTFDIAGIKLRMIPKEAFEEALNHGYELEYMDKTYANFIKWRLERECMDSGVYIHERKQECIKENAKETGDYYINFMEFSKKDTKEKIRTFFTSSFSGNKLYRVTYYNEGDNSLGDTTASLYIKDKRKTEFLNWVVKKYGNPNNPGAMIWSEGNSSPYFQAFTSGYSVNFNLILEDPMMLYNDSQAMSKADVKNVTYSQFSF